MDIKECRMIMENHNKEVMELKNCKDHCEIGIYSNERTFNIVLPVISEKELLRLEEWVKVLSVDKDVEALSLDLGGFKIRKVNRGGVGFVKFIFKINEQETECWDLHMCKVNMLELGLRIARLKEID